VSSQQQNQPDDDKAKDDDMDPEKLKRIEKVTKKFQTKEEL
jgi:hypothetical protein